MIQRVFIVLAASLIAFAAHAFDANDRQKVEETVADFMIAFEADDMDAIMVPDSLLAYIAGKQQMAPDDLKRAMSAEMDRIMEQVEFLRLDVEWNRMVTGETDSGKPYAFLPFLSEFRLKSGEAHQTSSFNIVTEVDGDWYVVRIGSQTMWQFFQAAYPEFRDVTFPG